MKREKYRHHSREQDFRYQPLVTSVCWTETGWWRFVAIGKSSATNAESDRRRWPLRYRSILVGANKFADVAVFGVASVPRENNELLFRSSFTDAPMDQFVFATSALRGGVSSRLVLMDIFWNSFAALFRGSSKRRGISGVGGGVASTGISLNGGGLKAPEKEQIFGVCFSDRSNLRLTYPNPFH